MTTKNDAGLGVYQRVTDPAGTKYLVQAVPSGHLDLLICWEAGLLDPLVLPTGEGLINRLFFGGRWTLLAWLSTVDAPKRHRVYKQRFADRSEATAEFDRLVARIEESGIG